MISMPGGKNPGVAETLPYPSCKGLQRHNVAPQRAVNKVLGQYRVLIHWTFKYVFLSIKSP